ncbi:golgin subfamily A member 3-like [Dermacentor albipictus]|uniref:golgin subfamily A member 3-like n=1 Tax=Dermacentor albipictus TaxID=60249 RepID=UPI0031FCF222
MAYLELNVEQVNQAAELLPYDAQDIDPLASVVDPRLDIRSSKSATAGSNVPFLAESEQSRRSSVASLAGSTTGKAQAPPGPPADAVGLPTNGTEQPPAVLPDDPVYPNISPRVAEYVATENPTLCTQVAQCIEKHSRVHSPRRGHTAPASSTTPRSPLKCMAQAADALSVQQSTIGVPLKPSVPTKAIYQELVEYPPESIVASVDERTSWLRTILSAPAATGNHVQSSQNGPTKSSPLLRNQCTITRRELPSVHNWRRPSEEPGFDADNFDSASVCSETESNLSWVSDVDDEIRMLKSMMVPRASQFAVLAAREKTVAATQTDLLSSTGSVMAHVGVETDETDHFALLKEKAHLEGELDMLQGELGRLVQAKSELKTQAAAAEARCQKLAEEKDAAVQREAGLQQELQTLKMESVRYGRVVGDYDSLIHSKESETGFLHDEAAVLSNQNRELKVAVEELKVDLESRCGAIEGLKKKIAELHVESQSAVRARAQLEAENTSLRNQLQVIEKSKDWFRDQLHESQQGRNQLHKEHVATQAEKISLESSAEMLRAENARLAQELLEARQRSVRDKESLMKRLEDIEADLLEREAMLSREAAAAQPQQPVSEAGDLSSKFRVAELEEQLRSTESSLAERSAALSALERERTELVTEVQRLRLRLSDSELGRRNQDELLREGVQKVRRLQTELAASEELATELRSQKAALEVALAAANEDKRVVGESLGTLTENLARLEGNFKLIRTEQVAKTAQIDQLQREKASLGERLSEAETALSLARKELESRSNARSQAQAMEASQLRKQYSDLQNVLRLLEAELKKAAAEAREAATQHGVDKEKLQQSEERLEHAEAQLETMAQRNAVLQSQLQESAQRLVREEARRVASLQEQAQLHDLSTWETRVRELEQTLATREMASREQERMHKSNIRLLTRKLREKMKELKLAQVQLANAANAESQQREDQLRRQDQKLVNQEVQTLEQPQRASAEAQTDEAAKTQEEQTELAEKNQELLLQLEREQGRLAGSLKAQEELRACVEQLEQQLSAQGGHMAELQCQLEQVQGRADQAQALHQTSVADLQRELEKERTLSKELRQRIFEEKRRGGQLQRQLSSLKQGLSEASQSADAGRLKAQTQAERAQSLELQLREAQGRLEALRGDLAASQAARQELEAKLRNAHERDPALEQQMKLLSWNVKEKTQEVAALQERVRLAETAHQAEVMGLRRQLEEAQQHHSNLSAELMSVRKEKFTFQARLQELKNVLRSRMEQCKELQRQLTELAETTEFALPNVTPDYDDSYITELLQQCSSQPTSRPLGSLQVCLDSLKQDLNTLHSQIRQNVELPKKELVT